MLNEIYNMVSAMHDTEGAQRFWLADLTVRTERLKDQLEELLPDAFAEEFASGDTLSKVGFTGYRQELAGDGSMYNSGIHDRMKRESNESTDRTIQGVGYDAETQYYQFLVKLYCQIERTGERLRGRYSTNIQDISTPSQDIIQHLFKHAHDLERLNRHVMRAFKTELCFDNLTHANKALRLTPRQDLSKLPGNLVSTADAWNSEARPVDSLGDGIRAYLKLILGLIEPATQIVFIDEPEAFLHPPQRRDLGQVVAQLCKEQGKQVFISTHDTEFLNGMMRLSAPPSIKVFYLTSEGQEKKHVEFNISDIKRLIGGRKSNFVTERLLNSFFYDVTILCEDESDRAFYELVAANYFPEQSQNTNFVGLNGLDSVLNTRKKLLELGQKVGVIIDIDHLMWRGCPVDDSSIKARHDNLRVSLNQKLSLGLLNKDKLKATGLAYLGRVDSSLQADALRLLVDYQAHGIFVVPVGELESWTPHLGDFSSSIKYINEKRRRGVGTFIKQVLNY